MKSRWNNLIGSCLKNLARMSCCEFNPFPFVPFALPLLRDVPKLLAAVEVDEVLQDRGLDELGVKLGYAVH